MQTLMETSTRQLIPVFVLSGATSFAILTNLFAISFSPSFWSGAVAVNVISMCLGGVFFGYFFYDG